MNHLKFFMVALFVTIFQGYSFSQTNEEGNNPTEMQAGDVEVLYFHFERRCVTCLEVEKVARNAVKELFNGSVSFEVYNLDEKEGKEKAKEKGISTQSLVVVKGKTKVDITAEGFMHAKNSPDKLKTIINDKVSSLLY